MDIDMDIDCLADPDHENDAFMPLDPMNSSRSMVSETSTSRKTTTKRKKNSENSRVSQRGPNWQEDDSILLVRARKYAEEHKKCTGSFLSVANLY
jgi:hypothetical protein